MRSLLLLFAFVAVTLSTSIQNGQRADAVLDGMFCPICKDLIKGAEGMGEDELLDYIAGFVKTECDKLPLKKLQQDCFDAIMGKSQQIFDGLLSGHASPDALCKDITLC
ncbi:hypothetical protein PFISCL1PPCAC_24167 [Pristionchus fissidentatus]|uniref:Saposin B-type domain-containing protein n=1 Tax=Pristionchus fissidentatus TaxID=1538716 RepID=A0AAV5WMN0_9BILA|nr:hypothetical protein PFISCL1PPCAC_24167 [Pristionchus fissidentatus]